MVQIAGTEQFELPSAVVWRSLVDPQFLCQCFPNVDRIVSSDERSATLIVRPGFSFVRGTLEVAFQFVDLQPVRHGQVTIQLKGIGSSAKLAAAFDLTSSDAGSTVEWIAEVRELGGLLKAVSHGLMQGAAQKVAADTWSNIRAQLRAKCE
jgi:carbon monoxide dehydrogenase subunit G